MPRDLRLLEPATRALAERLVFECAEAGLDMLVTCTWRSHDEQAALYAQGRTTPGKIVTNARPGESRHNRTVDGFPASTAFDVVPLRNGKPVWDAAAPEWQQVGAIGERIGLEWAGRWKRFKEYPHFQLKEEQNHV